MREIDVKWMSISNDIGNMLYTGMHRQNREECKVGMKLGAVL